MVKMSISITAIPELTVSQEQVKPNPNGYFSPAFPKNGVKKDKFY